jgi:SAM-dependent methyltransferase
MLEVGCASGRFLSNMKHQGWDTKGIEFSENVARYARGRGLDVFAGPLEQAPRPEYKYDLVVGWMVLEHLSDPVSSLKRLAEWTKEGGWLAISVPNAKSYEFEYFKQNWFALQAPTHLFHFTPSTLAEVLRASGWKVERVFHQRVLTNLLVSLGYCLEDKRPDSKLAQSLQRLPARSPGVNALAYPLAWILALFGQTGRMTVWATKQSDHGSCA